MILKKISANHKKNEKLNQILKLEENSRTNLFCSAFLLQLQNLEKKFRVGGKNSGEGVGRNIIQNTLEIQKKKLRLSPKKI